jgi:hypothetical protein
MPALGNDKFGRFRAHKQMIHVSAADFAFETDDAARNYLRRVIEAMPYPPRER